MKRIEKAVKLHGDLVKVKQELKRIHDELRGVVEPSVAYELSRALFSINSVINHLKGKINEVLSWFEEEEKKLGGVGENEGDGG